MATKRIWQPIQFNREWIKCDTSILDDIAPSWFERRKKLRADSSAYSEFLNRLKREHAIETGVVEKIYDLKRGITETFIKKGFVQSYLSHGDTNIPENDLMKHLNDHLDAVNFVFDVVKEERPLTIGFIKELHKLVTRNQKFAVGRDPLGNKTKIKLLKGKFKEAENNPTAQDGTKILYCPPLQVHSEMDMLIELYNKNNTAHPLVLATWFHHAFTIIHPFQDGNGRVARLLTSLIFIKNDLFPFTVLREGAKVKYIEALERADTGQYQDLVTYFGKAQTRSIHRALNIKEIVNPSLSEVQDIFVEKIEAWKHKKDEEHINMLVQGRNKIFKYSSSVMTQLMNDLKNKLGPTVKVSLSSCPFENEQKQHYFYQQIIAYAKKHDYFLNTAYPKAWVLFKINLEEEKVMMNIHKYGNTTSATLPLLLNDYESQLKKGDNLI
ncbi:MAG: Fic family protein, partial [Marinirhabdus sp.]